MDDSWNIVKFRPTIRNYGWYITLPFWEENFNIVDYGVVRQDLLLGAAENWHGMAVIVANKISFGFLFLKFRLWTCWGGYRMWPPPPPIRGPDAVNISFNSSFNVLYCLI